MPVHSKFITATSGAFNSSTSKAWTHPNTIILLSPCRAFKAALVRFLTSSIGNCGISIPVSSLFLLERKGFEEWQEPTQIPHAAQRFSVTFTSYSQRALSVRACTLMASNGQSTAHWPQPLHSSRWTSAAAPVFFGGNQGMSISSMVMPRVSTQVCPAVR